MSLYVEDTDISPEKRPDDFLRLDQSNETLSPNIAVYSFTQSMTHQI